MRPEASHAPGKMEGNETYNAFKQAGAIANFKIVYVLN